MAYEWPYCGWAMASWHPGVGFRLWVRAWTVGWCWKGNCKETKEWTLGDLVKVGSCRYTRVVHSSHFWLIFGFIFRSFSGVWQKNDQNGLKNDVRNEVKMATVNVPKRKHFKNEAKMHFTYLRQCLAHSNSTSKGLDKNFAWVHHLLLSPSFYLQVVEMWAMGIT